MLRIMGCLLIIAGCTAAGFFKSLSYKERTAELQDIIEMLKLMHIEIVYKKEPLGKTFKHAAVMKRCWFAEVMQRCSRRLEEQRPLYEAWREALREKKRECPLHEKDIAVLNDLVLGLGRSDAEGQQKILDAAALRFRGCLEDAGEQELRQGRMYCGMGAAAGVVIAVILI